MLLFPATWAVLFLVTPPVFAVHIAYPSGGGGCEVVHFPSWSLPGDAKDKDYTFKGFCCGSVYLFRHAVDTPRSVLLVRVELRWESTEITSPDIYWLNLTGTPRVRRATISEWDLGMPIPDFVGTPGTSPRGNGSIDYAGRLFPKEGQEWPSSSFGSLSSHATWLSAASRTVHKRSRDGVALRATTYVDVFHVASGKLVAAVVGTLSDFDMDRGNQDSGYFVDDQFFVAGLGESRRTMLICDLQRLVPSR